MHLIDFTTMKVYLRMLINEYFNLLLTIVSNYSDKNMSNLEKVSLIPMPSTLHVLIYQRVITVMRLPSNVLFNIKYEGKMKATQVNISIYYWKGNRSEVVKKLDL